MVTVPAPKTYKILSIALNGSNMVSVLSHDTCACTAWTSLHRLDLLDLRHLLHVLDLVQLLVLRLAFTCVDAQPAEELCILCPHLSSSAVLASHLWMHSCADENCACTADEYLKVLIQNARCSGAPHREGRDTPRKQ